MRERRQHSGEQRTSTPNDVWMEMVPQTRAYYDGILTPQQHTEPFSKANRDIFAPSREIMEAVKANIAFSEDWRTYFKQETLES